MTPEEERAAGMDALRVWDDPAFVKARTSVREAIVQRWATSPVADLEGQHELRLMLKLLDDLEGNLKQAIATGRMADMEIERSAKEKLKRRIKGW
jgi:hypothetical protein